MIAHTISPREGRVISRCLAFCFTAYMPDYLRASAAATLFSPLRASRHVDVTMLIFAFCLRISPVSPPLRLVIEASFDYFACRAVTGPAII